MTPIERAELRDLCHALREGDGDAAQLAKLDRLLDGNVEAQRYYLQMVDLEVALRWQIESVAVHQSFCQLQAAGRRPGVDKPTPALDAIATWWRPWAAVASVAAVLAMVIGGMRLADGPQRVVQTPPAATSSPTAAATDAARIATPAGVAPSPALAVVLVAEDASPEWQIGRRLAAGRFTLEQGLVRIEFARGAIVSLEGPAEFELVSEQRGVLHHGKLAALAPAWATGFAIAAAQVELSEASGEFGLSVEARGRTRVTVFRGEVRVEVDSQYLGLVQPFHLTREEGLEIDAAGAVTTAILGDHVRFQRLQQTADLRTPRVGNGSFEYPQTRDATSAVAAGWTLMSHPFANADQMDVRAGIVKAAESTLPANLPAPDGRQWAYLTARTFADGRATYTSMHQAVGLVSANVTYRLQATLARGAATDPDVRYTVGLYAGNKEEGPRRPLVVWAKQPLPKGRPTVPLDVTWHVPRDTPYQDEELYLMFEAVPGRKPGTQQVLLDNVRLELVP